MFIPDPDLGFLPIPDPRSQIPDAGVKKEPDPGSATLFFHSTFFVSKDNEERVQSPAGPALPG